MPTARRFPSKTLQVAARVVIIYAVATISEALAIAIQHHQAGRLQAAEQIYRQILAVEPNLAEVHNNLGIVLEPGGSSTRRSPATARALELKPDFAAAHNNLGNALNAGEASTKRPPATAAQGN